MSAISSFYSSVSLTGTFDHSQLLALPCLLGCSAAPLLPSPPAMSGSITAAAVRALDSSDNFDVYYIENCGTFCTLVPCDVSQKLACAVTAPVMVNTL